MCVCTQRRATIIIMNAFVIVSGSRVRVKSQGGGAIRHGQTNAEWAVIRGYCDFERFLHCLADCSSNANLVVFIFWKGSRKMITYLDHRTKFKIVNL